MKGFDGGQRNRLEPDGLPDARYRGIPDPPRLADLLAARLGALIAGVPDRDLKPLAVAAGREQAGHVESKRIVPAAMVPGRLAVDPNGRLPVNGAKVQ